MATPFGAELRRRRELLRMSRVRLYQLSGVSDSQVGNIETKGAVPFRPTVIDLARALDWDVDEALALVDYDPLTDDERAQLASVAEDLRTRLDRIWPELNRSQRIALVMSAEVMAHPDIEPSSSRWVWSTYVDADALVDDHPPIRPRSTAPTVDPEPEPANRDQDC